MFHRLVLCLSCGDSSYPDRGSQLMRWGAVVNCVLIVNSSSIMKSLQPSIPHLDLWAFWTGFKSFEILHNNRAHVAQKMV